MAKVVVKYIHRVYATVIIDGGRTYNSVMERDREAVKLARRKGILRRRGGRYSPDPNTNGMTNTLSIRECFFMPSVT